MIIFLLFQTVILGWVYGYSNISEQAELKTREKIPKIYGVFIKYI